MSTSRAKTGCCVVGGGPGGMFLALLLARQGVDVTLLEAHRDFDRDFRGDTIHPSTLELLDRMGLARALHALPHTKLAEISLTAGGVRYGLPVRLVCAACPSDGLDAMLAEVLSRILQPEA
jgi:2-polyprenyl-6-methoxyphenol hydroxylase-like FAD-dependent oxidoreductase